jgi:hypothetical protein
MFKKHLSKWRKLIKCENFKFSLCINWNEKVFLFVFQTNENEIDKSKIYIFFQYKNKKQLSNVFFYFFDCTKICCETTRIRFDKMEIALLTKNISEFFSVSSYTFFSHSHFSSYTTFFV